MSHLEILLPFALPPEKVASAMLHSVRFPSLSVLVSRTRKASRLPDFPAFSRALPHEAWLAREAGLVADIQAASSPPLAAAAMRLHGLPQETGYWFILNPTHLLVGQDKMIMVDHRMLELTETESTALYEAAAPCFDDAGLTARYGDAATWFLRADDWQSLRTTTPDQACGRHLMHWMPEGKGELSWRALLNSVQMAWHAHPVNAGRTQRGVPTINALWLWGGAEGMPANCPSTARILAACRFEGGMRAYGECFPQQEDVIDAASLLRRPPAERLLLLDNLAAPALSGDWDAWQAGYAQLEKDWLAPLLAGIKVGRIDSLTLHLSNDQRQKTFAVTSGSLRKFWIRPSLKALLS